MAPIACTPPALKILVMPAIAAVNKIAGFNWPAGFGGEHKMISLQPASLAGTANIKMVENNGALPPGIYNPIFSMGVDLRQHCTPGIVSTTSILSSCTA